MSDDHADHPDDADVDRQRWRCLRRRRTRVTVAVVVTAVAVGVVVGVLDGRHGDRSARTGLPHWLEVVATCLSAVGVVLIVATLSWAGRTGTLSRARQNPLWGLDGQQRRQMMREIRGRQPVDPRHRRVCIETARAMAGRRWMLVMWFGVALTTTGQLSSPHPLVVHLFGAAAVVCLLLAAAQTLADSHRARRFLERHEHVEAGRPDHLGHGAHPS